MSPRRFRPAPECRSLELRAKVPYTKNMAYRIFDYIREHRVEQVKAVLDAHGAQALRKHTEEEEGIYLRSKAGWVSDMSSTIDLHSRNVLFFHLRILAVITDSAFLLCVQYSCDMVQIDSFSRSKQANKLRTRLSQALHKFCAATRSVVLSSGFDVA